MPQLFRDFIASTEISCIIIPLTRWVKLVDVLLDR
jgi:hypothetical protein